MSNVIDLQELKSDKEWQRILPILAEVEAIVALREATPEARAAAAAEDERIETQISAIKCCTRAKLLLLRALNNPESGRLTTSEVRLKKLLESDRAVAAALSTKS